METNGARPKEKRDDMRSSGGYRERQNKDNTGARPKETLDARSCSGGQNTDYQLPSQSGIYLNLFNLFVVIINIYIHFVNAQTFRPQNIFRAFSYELSRRLEKIQQIYFPIY